MQRGRCEIETIRFRLEFEGTRRLAYAIVQGRPTRYNASAQVFAENDVRSRLVWIVDLLPNDLAGTIGSMMEQGSAVMKQALEGRLTPIGGR